MKSIRKDDVFLTMLGKMINFVGIHLSPRGRDYSIFAPLGEYGRFKGYGLRFKGSGLWFRV